MLARQLDDHMGDRWEAAFREHLVRLAARGELGEEIVDIGRWWRDSPPVEIDAVALAGRGRTPVLAGEAKWAKRVDARRVARDLERKAEGLPGLRADTPLRLAVAARERVDHGEGVVASRRRRFSGGERPELRPLSHVRRIYGVGRCWPPGELDAQRDAESRVKADYVRR